MRKQASFERDALALSRAEDEQADMCQELRQQCDEVVVDAERDFAAKAPIERRAARAKYLEDNCGVEFVDTRPSGAVGSSSPSFVDFPDKSVDKIYMLNTLHFLPDLLATLREVRRILRPTGVLVCATKIEAVRRGVAEGLLPESVPHDEDDISQAFKEAGFSVAVRNRHVCADVQAQFRRDCVVKYASTRAALRAEQSERVQLSRGGEAVLGEELVGAVFRPELSTEMQRCACCRDDVMGMTADLSCTSTVYIAPGHSSHGSHVLCVPCHSLKCEFSRELQAFDTSEVLDPDSQVQID